MLAGTGKSGAAGGSDPIAMRAQFRSAHTSFPLKFLRFAATIAMTVGRVDFALRQFFKRTGQFRPHRGKVALDPAIAPDQDVIVIRQPAVRQFGAQQFAKAALHPVADDRISDLLCNRNSVTLALSLVRMGEQDETGPRDPLAAIGAQKVGALADYGRSRFAGHDMLAA